MGQPRAFIITGASTGIGRACALHLDRRGARVFAGVRREADADALRAAGSERLEPILLDVTDPEQIAAAVALVTEQLGGLPLSGLVNNAGIAVGGPLELTSLDSVRWQYEVNVFGLIAMSQAFIPLLRPAAGRIVNIGSIGGVVAGPFMTPYNGTKHAVEAISDGLRGELRPWGMHVCVVEPGAIATPIWRKGKELADRTRDSLGAQGAALYGEAVGKLGKVVEESERRGIPPERVARAVEHALSAPRPRTRYLVGVDAHMLAFLRWLLPDRLFDWLYLKAMGLV